MRFGRSSVQMLKRQDSVAHIGSQTDLGKGYPSVGYSGHGTCFAYEQDSDGTWWRDFCGKPNELPTLRTRTRAMDPSFWRNPAPDPPPPPSPGIRVSTPSSSNSVSP